MRIHLNVSITICLVCLLGSRLAAEDKPAHPLSAKRQAGIVAKFKKSVAELTKQIDANPKDIGAYSRRGDAYFHLGQFKKAVADYEKMVALNPKIAVSHWRRGIAYFYAGQYKQAAKQFEIYNTFDMVDRENGIWRFFSQAKAYGIKKARANLLKYKTTDREPFGDVYKLFAQKIKPEQILKNINGAKIGRTEREKRLFYAQLYIGLNHAVEGRDKQAVKHLREAVANKWGPDAGFGPNYMWHVGRLHYGFLTRKK